MKERMRFLNELLEVNERYSLDLAKTAQLSKESICDFLRVVLRRDHNLAQSILQNIKPCMSDKLFWNIVSKEISPDSDMWKFLNYYSGGIANKWLHGTNP